MRGVVISQHVGHGIVAENDIGVLVYHVIKDLNWRESIRELFPAAEEKGLEIISAAEFRGFKNDLLEARRKELWEKHPE